MKFLILSSLLLTFTCFSQENTKQGTIKVAKTKNVKDSTVIAVKNDKTTNKPVNSEFISPEYFDGEFGMLQYINNNIIYPNTKKIVRGTCYVNAIVEPDGSLSSVAIAKGIDNCPDCDKEAIRLVKNMPKWIPGTKNGKAVPVGITLPIKFNIN